jgi:hypothetical protein
MEHPSEARTRLKIRTRRPRAALGGVGVAVALLLGACTNAGGSSSGAARPEKLPQPVVANVSVAPEGARVDTTAPTFSDPTNITNPLFPASDQKSVLLLGRVDGQPFRTEVTLLPETRIIEWRGQRVEALVSQYVAFLGGRIHEVAYDFYAQADDGSVWYFGEDVFNFADGKIIDTHGTWIAGKDGPAAMIMPADPTVGDVYRPENIPGFVFEEVTVKSVDETLGGPLGAIDGGLVVEELHMDGATETKTFAPAYGEFYTAGGGDVEALALAVPTDAAPGPTPAELETLSNGALTVFEMAGLEDWSEASTTLEDMARAWRSYKENEGPKMIEPRLTRALRSLADTVDARASARTRQAAIDAAQLSLDLQLRHKPPTVVDMARFDLWLAQLAIDAEAGDASAVTGDFFTLDYIRDRIVNDLDGPDGTVVNSRLEELQGAVGDADFAAVVETADQLRGALARVAP